MNKLTVSKATIIYFFALIFVLFSFLFEWYILYLPCLTYIVIRFSLSVIEDEEQYKINNKKDR
jgi:hypothetical protein